MVMRRSEGGPQTRPSALEAIPEHATVFVDVRDDLRSGREPFDRIMSALREVPPGGALCLRAIFEPVPLYGVLVRHGFTHHTERLGGDDWRVWFYAADDAASGVPSTAADATAAGATAAGATAARAAAAGDGEPAADDVGDPVVVLDVRGLEPPEPMVRTLAALEALPPGHTLVQLNVRVPRFLLPELDARGFRYEIREQSPELVRVFIRRVEGEGNPVADGWGVADAPRILDVRIIPPREKHPTIFGLFRALEPGTSFVLVNDHDPLPLRYQFQFEHENEFSWTYLEEGPTVWKVEIGRRGAS